MPMVTTTVPAICIAPSDSFNAKAESNIVSTTVPVTNHRHRDTRGDRPAPADPAKQVEVADLREPDAQARSRRPCIRRRGELQHVPAAASSSSANVPDAARAVSCRQIVASTVDVADAGT